MGIYLNPDNKGFWESIRSKIYVDKTRLLSVTNELINTKEKFVCVSRPRRFGKSKYDKTAQSALQQIKDRQYTQALEGYTGELVLVGINYDKDRKDKPHSCVIEKIIKG